MKHTAHQADGATVSGSGTQKKKNVYESRSWLQGQAALPSQEKAPRSPLNGKLSGPHSRSKRFGEGIRNPDCTARSLVTILSYPGSILTPADNVILPS
jgi:hypothetical protein